MKAKNSVKNPILATNEMMSYFYGPAICDGAK